MIASSWIAWFLQVLTRLAEAYTVRSGGPRVNAEESHAHDNIHQKPNEREATLNAAYDFFETNPKEATHASIKSKFRKLSLLHHPDRNGNSQESIETMQKVNNYYKLIIEDLDHLSGTSPDHDDETAAQSDDNDDDGSTCSVDSFKRQEQEKREREKMEREMRREWEEIKKKRTKLERIKKRTTHKIRGEALRNHLDYQDGRDRAHQAWQDAVREMQQQQQQESNETSNTTDSMHDIDEENSSEKTTSSSKKSKKPQSKEPTKPENLIMECCLKDAAIALRSRQSDTAIDIIQDEVDDIVKNVIRISLYCGKMPDKSEIVERIQGYLVRSYDEDGNTILHYAVYYESMDVIDMIHQMSKSFNCFQDVFLKENCRKKIPSDFACVCDSSILERMQALTEEANIQHKEEQRRMEIWPSLVSLLRAMWHALRLLSLANAVLTYCVGRFVFGTGPLFSFIIMAGVQLCYQSTDDPDEAMESAGQLFSWHSMWIFYKGLYAILPWELYLLLLPFTIVACCSARKKTNNESRMESFELLIGILGFPFFVVIFCLKLLAEMCGRLPMALSKPQLDMMAYQVLFSLVILAIPSVCGWIFSSKE